GWTLSTVHNEAESRGWVRRLFGLGSAVIGIGAASMAALAIGIIAHGIPSRLPLRLHPTDRRFLEIFASMAARLSPSLMIWIAISLTGVALIIVGLVRRNPTVQGCGTLAIAAAGSLFWFAWMNPALAERETLEGFAHQIALNVPAGALVEHIGLGDCELNFYSPEPLNELTHFSCEDPTGPRYIVIRQRDFAAMAPALRGCLNPVLESAPVDNLGPRLLVKEGSSGR
ncbi:MAG TPA: hypothetical protein VJN94_01405, partial [Candidatus Binataceae bacterium]|nr:hypothetical protein [Candidatus Binataceae bacterium]